MYCALAWGLRGFAWFCLVCLTFQVTSSVPMFRIGVLTVTYSAWLCLGQRCTDYWVFEFAYSSMAEAQSSSTFLVDLVRRNRNISKNKARKRLFASCDTHWSCVTNGSSPAKHDWWCLCALLLSHGIAAPPERVVSIRQPASRTAVTTIYNFSRSAHKSSQSIHRSAGDSLVLCRD